jgi:hypothetical protein
MMWGLLELVWQAAIDNATMLVVEAGNAERDGDALGAEALQKAAEVLDAQAQQDRATLDYLEGGG